MNDHELALIGGYWFWFTICHLFTDFLGQDHETATTKSTDKVNRFFHCAIYSMLMLIPMITFKLTPGEMFVSGAALFLSHYVGDSYFLALWWFKHVRQPPWTKGRTLKEIGTGFRHRPITMELHIEIILFILVDQLWHILWLILPAIFAFTDGGLW